MRMVKIVVGVLLAINAIAFVCGVALAIFPKVALAAPEGMMESTGAVTTEAERIKQTGTAGTLNAGALMMIGAGLAVGLGCVGAGVAVAQVGAAALGAISEKPEMLGKTLIFLGLAEGIAIYGLIICIMIYTSAMALLKPTLDVIAK